MGVGRGNLGASLHGAGGQARNELARAQRASMNEELQRKARSRYKIALDFSLDL